MRKLMSVKTSKLCHFLMAILENKYFTFNIASLIHTSKHTPLYAFT